MEFNKEVEKAGSNVEIITAYDRMEIEKLAGHEEGFDEGLEEGRKKGHEEGLKQGIEQARIELAKKMLQKDMPLDEVHSLIPEISLKELEKIKGCLIDKR